ncbi:dipeptidase PepE [Rheinheimera riviphila]|uniref:Dipeptidase PepE n=1 Tax=Rheinheimera riviphila TaxID=1834037 RepID=A0A437R236_9GAMM|nr:dipeptidase PepE [Rheinheimera riviphila]RVU40783.1 dipeptidase PepE [Rheinheimera riviphila]
MQLLLLSSSRADNSDYLAPGLAQITEILGDIQRVLFIPYAGVSVGYDAYQQMVQSALGTIGITVDSIHQFENPALAVAEAQAIVIGGGNTFHLLHQLYQHQLIELIREKVTAGTPYIGWSAGSNLAGQSIRTTNDMPIIEPPSFNALNLLPFQLNPHYTDFKPAGFHGETRDMRLNEFMLLNPTTAIFGLPEGTALRREGNQLHYVGTVTGYLFVGGEKTPVAPGADLSGLLQRP